MELSQAIRDQLSRSTRQAQSLLTAASERAVSAVQVAAAYRRAYFTTRKLNHQAN